MNNSTLVISDHCKRKVDLTLGLREKDYMFLGSDLYPVNSLCPTKRLLNTFREICNGQEGSKFVTQDKADRAKQKLDINKHNIFSAARKELAMKKKLKCTITIQRWWRRVSNISSKSF